MSRLRLRVPEQGADHRQREAGAREQARVGVPEVVDADAGDAGRLADLRPGLLEIAAVTALAAGEDEFGIVGAPRRELPPAARAPAPTAGRDARSSASSSRPGFVQTPFSRSNLPTWRRTPRRCAAPVKSSRRTMFAACWSPIAGESRRQAGELVGAEVTGALALGIALDALARIVERASPNGCSG